MAETVVSLLDVAGEWTHRDRHRQRRFPIDVPDHAVELRIRLRWEPHDLGSERLENHVGVSVWSPEGFRGSGAVATAGRWIVIGESTASPGCLAGPITAGTWTINIGSSEILNNGADSGYLSWQVEVEARIAPSPAGARVAQDAIGTAPAAARPAAGGAGWYRGDLHAHTVHSDGIITVGDRLRGAVGRGLDFLAITDHNTISHHGELDGLADRITHIRGSEITTYHGHINCFGLATAIDWRDDARGGGAASIVEQAHRQDAIVSINHPNAFGDPWCSGCHWDYARADYSTFDAMEVWNGRWAEAETDNEGALAFWTDLLDAGFRLTAVSGTDSHSAEEDDYPALPRDVVYADDRSERGILDAIRRGRVYLSSGPTVAFRAVGSGGAEAGLPGEHLASDGSVDLTVDVDRVEGPATLWFVTSGSTFALGECGPAGTRHAASALAARGWWRLEVRRGAADNGDMLAITNPVYLT
jgi:hypothetical protein